MFETANDFILPDFDEMLSEFEEIEVDFLVSIWIDSYADVLTPVTETKPTQHSKRKREDCVNDIEAVLTPSCKRPQL